MSALKRSRYAGQIPAPLRLRWFEARGGRSPVATPAESDAIVPEPAASKLKRQSCDRRRGAA